MSPERVEGLGNYISVAFARCFESGNLLRCIVFTSADVGWRVYNSLLKKQINEKKNSQPKPNTDVPPTQNEYRTDYGSIRKKAITVCLKTLRGVFYERITNKLVTKLNFNLSTKKQQF